MDTMPSERIEALRAIVEIARSNVNLIDKLYRIIECPTPPATTVTPVPDTEEQAILDLWDGLEDGTKLSTATILKMLDDSPNNGRQKRRLAEMVKKGFLCNDGTGYRNIFHV